jgi:hypothetical protein
MCESALCENVTTDNVLGKLNYYLKSIDAEYRTGLLVLPILRCCWFMLLTMRLSANTEKVG